MEFELTGLDEVKRHLDQMQRGLQKEEGARAFALEEIVTPMFLARFTSFTSLTDLFTQWGQPMTTPEDLDTADVDSLNAFIARTTLFPTWPTLLETAYVEHVGPVLQERMKP